MRKDLTNELKSVLNNYILEFVPVKPGEAYFNLKYKGKEIEISYYAYSPVGSRSSHIPAGLVLNLTMNLGAQYFFDLEVVPRIFLDKFNPFSRKVDIKISSFSNGLTVVTNNRELTTEFLSLPSVSNLVHSYGISFIEIKEGYLRFNLDMLPSEDLNILEQDPNLILKYLNLLVGVIT